jgi:hypothetical protein
MCFRISFAKVPFSLFLDIRIKSHGKMELGEIWTGQVSVGANQHELTTSAHKGGQHEEGGLKKPFENFPSSFLNLAPTLGKVKCSIPHGA